MLNKILLTLTTVGVMTLTAASGTYKVSLLDDSVIGGQQVDRKSVVRERV